MGEQSLILITGAAGFVGCHVSQAAQKAGLKIRTLARTQAAGIDWCADLSDQRVVATLPLSTVTTIIHCAAAVPSRSGAFERDNVQAAASLAACLVAAESLRRIVHISSIAVYRRPVAAPWMISEDASVVDILSEEAEPYARSKRLVEISLDRVAELRRDVFVSHLRASSIYGPRMVSTTLLPTIVRCARQNAPIILRGPRAYRQNFVHVEDVASLALMFATNHHARSGPLNAFSDDTYGLFDLANMVRTRLNSKSAIVDETENRDIIAPHFDNSRARCLHRFRRLEFHLRDTVP